MATPSRRASEETGGVTRWPQPASLAGASGWYGRSSLSRYRCDRSKPIDPWVTFEPPVAKGDEVRPKVQWTAEDRARHRAIRDMFRNWHPSPEELIATGEAANFDLHGEYGELRPFVEEIKRAREAAGLTLAEVSRRCGIDQPALSRLENGHNKNPTLDTLWRYAAAVGRRLVLTTEAIRDTRPTQAKAKRVRAARER